MREKSESCRSTTPVSHRNAWGCHCMCETSTDSLHPGGRTVGNPALVGPEKRQLARQPPATPQSTIQVNPGRTADNSERHADERLRAHTGGSGPRHPTTTVCYKGRNHLGRLQGERALRLPYTCCTGRQSGHDRACTQQESRYDVLARPRGGACGLDHYTARRR